MITENVKDTKDESMQAICSEIITGFMSTIIWYGHLKESRKHYKEMFETMIDCFEEVSDDVCWDWEAAIDFFMHETDPWRFDFLLEDIFKKWSVVDATEHNL